jgi:hypothetical protein
MRKNHLIKTIGMSDGKNETGWDLGKASPAITHYMTQYRDKGSYSYSGCGNAYETEIFDCEWIYKHYPYRHCTKAVEALKRLPTNHR